MNTPNNRPVLSLPFNGKPAHRPGPVPGATLTKSELRKIVAAHLG